MKRIVSVVILLLFALSISFSCSRKPKSVLEEVDMLNALTKVQNSIEEKVSYDEYVNLLSDAKEKLSILKEVEGKNNCFFNAVNKSYASFEISRKAWKLKNEAKDEKRRIDMDTTLSFALGFGSVSLASAKQCFK